jgi:hypothetical protein
MRKAVFSDLCAERQCKPSEVSFLRTSLIVGTRNKNLIGLTRLGNQVQERPIKALLHLQPLRIYNLFATTSEQEYTLNRPPL